jgi:hypothetical protein
LVSAPCQNTARVVVISPCGIAPLISLRTNSMRRPT